MCSLQSPFQEQELYLLQGVVVSAPVYSAVLLICGDKKDRLCGAGLKKVPFFGGSWIFQGVYSGKMLTRHGLDTHLLSF